MKPTSIAFERRYDDDSGVEYGVRMVARGRDGGEGYVEIEHVDTVEIPLNELPWLMDALDKVLAIWTTRE